MGVTPTRMNGRSDARYGAPDRGHGASSRAAKGRVCDEPGCGTNLSTYNSTTSCGVHEKLEPKHALHRTRS